MKIIIKKAFIKDLDGIEKQFLLRTKEFVAFCELNNQQDIFLATDIKQMVGSKMYYRIRMGQYRIGVKFEDEAMYFIRIRHRKDIYRVFP